MEHPFQFMIGELESVQFYCWLITALVFWAGIFTMNLMLSGAAVLIFSIDTAIIKNIEGVLIHYNVNYPDWLIDCMYPIIPLLVVALLMVSFRERNPNAGDGIGITDEIKFGYPSKRKVFLSYKYRKQS
jgi:hypothetical protein